MNERTEPKWADSWGKRDTGPKDTGPQDNNELINLALERASAAEQKTEEVMNLLGKLYHWCRGLNDFRPDAPLPRKIKATLGDRKPTPEVITLLDNGQACVRAVLLDPSTLRLMVIDDEDGAHVVFSLTVDESSTLVAGLEQMWKPKDPLDL
jgi:hypothetical protein